MPHCSYCEHECEHNKHIHRFTTQGTPIRNIEKQECAYIICDECARYEICRECGYEAGDILCSYCRIDY